MKKILTAAFLLCIPFAASADVYVDPRCNDLEGRELADCAFKVRNQTEAELAKTYREALGYYPMKAKLKKAQKMWKDLAEYECASQSMSSYAAVDFSFCYVRKMQHREKEIRQLYLTSF